MFTLGPSFLKSFPSDIPSLFQFLQLIILLASYITPIEKPLSLIPSQSYRSTFSSLLTFNCHFPTLKNIRIQLPDSLVHLCYINATKIRLGSSYSSFFFFFFFFLTRSFLYFSIDIKCLQTSLRSFFLPNKRFHFLHIPSHQPSFDPSPVISSSKAPQVFLIC